LLTITSNIFSTPENDLLKALFHARIRDSRRELNQELIKVRNLYYVVNLNYPKTLPVFESSCKVFRMLKEPGLAGL
jgi:hypothetical protein